MLKWESNPYQMWILQSTIKIFFNLKYLSVFISNTILENN